jgi:hypothetical protein
MMNRHVRIRRLPKIMLALLFGIIASIAAAGMIAWMVHALGVQASWLFALVSLPPGIALGLLIAIPLSEQLLVGAEDTHQEGEANGVPGEPPQAGARDRWHVLSF